MPSLLSKAARGLANALGATEGGNPPVPYAGGRSSLFGVTDSVAAVAERAYEAYGSVGTLFAIVSQIGNAFSAVKWHLWRKTSVRDESRRQEILPPNAFLTVWNKPNNFYTGMSFRETVEQHLDLVGEGIIVMYKVGSLILEMWPVRPDRMQPVKHPTKYMTGWIYTGPNGEEVPLSLDQVVQIKMPNPADPYRGMGPVQSVLNDIDASKYSAAWNRNFFINGAQPGGVIEVDYRMNDDEFNDFLARWQYQHKGVANAHRVAVLENAKWVDTKFSMADMQFAELRNLPRELIREAYAFPKPMLGTVDDVNRANSDAAKEIMAENITKPRLRRWQDTFDTFVLPQFANGSTWTIEPEDPVPVNSEAKDRERVSMATSTALLVKAGYDPDDVTDATGMPRMRWVGIPAAAGSGTSNDSPNPIQEA